MNRNTFKPIPNYLENKPGLTSSFMDPDYLVSLSSIIPTSTTLEQAASLR
jgi:hypothetical protein